MPETINNVVNEQDTPVEVWFEPWAEGLTLAAHSHFRLVAQSAQAGDLEIDYSPERVIVYAWPGAVVRVYEHERLVRDFDRPFPALPPSVSMKQFVQLVFGRLPPLSGWNGERQS